MKGMTTRPSHTIMMNTKDMTTKRKVMTTKPKEPTIHKMCIRDRCHASGGEQARADRPVGNRPQIEHGGGVGGQTDDEHFAQDGRLGAESRLAHVDGK